MSSKILGPGELSCHDVSLTRGQGGQFSSFPSSPRNLHRAAAGSAGSQIGFLIERAPSRAPWCAMPSLGLRRYEQMGRFFMFKWALFFAVIALVAAVLGFGGIAVASAGITKVLIFVGLAVVALFVILGVVAGKKGTLCQASLPDPSLRPSVINAGPLASCLRPLFLLTLPLVSGFRRRRRRPRFWDRCRSGWACDRRPPAYRNHNPPDCRRRPRPRRCR